MKFADEFYNQFAALQNLPDGPNTLKVALLKKVWSHQIQNVAFPKSEIGIRNVINMCVIIQDML